MVYSKYELAVEQAHDMVRREECDLYLCSVKYPSGEEFVLRKSIIPGAASCLDCFRLPFHHHFRTAHSAVRAAKIFGSRMGRHITVDRKTVFDHVYRVNRTLHFKLCLT